MPSSISQAIEGRVGLLRFTDGHTVRAKIIHVDTGDRREIVYDVIEVVEVGPPRWAEVRAGTTSAAALADAESFDG